MPRLVLPVYAAFLAKPPLVAVFRRLRPAMQKSIPFVLLLLFAHFDFRLFAVAGTDITVMPGPIPQCGFPVFHRCATADLPAVRREKIEERFNVHVTAKRIGCGIFLAFFDCRRNKRRLLTRCVCIFFFLNFFSFASFLFVVSFFLCGICDALLMHFFTRFGHVVREVREYGDLRQFCNTSIVV